MARLFISQERLDRWSSEGKAVLEGEVMTLPALGRAFRLRAACHIVRLASDGDDAHGLIGKVKTEEQLAKLGAETYSSAVIVGETAYDSETGFLGEIVGGPRSSPSAH